MTPYEFIAKWRASALDERTPAEADPTGEAYCFERGAREDTGTNGRPQPTTGTCQARSSQP